MKWQDKAILTGLAVVIIAAVLPVLLPLISPLLGGLDLSWLTDGVISWGDVLYFAGSILTALFGEVMRRKFRYKWANGPKYERGNNRN